MIRTALIMMKQTRLYIQKFYWLNVKSRLFLKLTFQGLYRIFTDFKRPTRPVITVKLRRN